jgi:membrane protein DedA with SNARE-associated domain/membrane-associated phospholipid phosphatase
MDYLNSLTNWLYIHPHWAGVLTFFISLSESLAVVGLIVPGSVMMTTIGALIGSGVLPAWETITWAILGAVAGDSASYWLGQRYHEQLKRFWPFRTHPHWLERGEAFFLKHGGKSVFIGRFAGPMRPIVPVVAGMLNMQTKRFLLANISSALAWAPVYMAPGMLLGFASLELAPETLTRFILILIAVLLSIWLLAWFLQHIGLRAWHYVSQGLDRVWQRWAHTRLLRPLTVLLRNPQQRSGHGQLTLGSFLVVTIIVFCLFCLSVRQHGLAIEFNESVWHFFRGLRHPLLDHLMLGLTYLGEKIIWLPVIALLFGWMLWQGWRRSAWHWIVLCFISYGSIYVIKHIVAYVRPTGLFARLSENSFPSGHTTLAVALFGFLSVLLAERMSSFTRKWLLYVVASLILLVAISRLYLGAHWLSDVIGGFLLGLICLTFITLSYYREQVDNIRKLKLFGLVSLCLIACCFGYGYKHFRQELKDYVPIWQSKALAATAWWQIDSRQALYRTNRFDEPDEILNIQWASQLEHIEQVLSKKGWHKIPRTNLNEIINRVAAKDRKQQLPLMANLYQDRAPALVMVKKTTDENLLLVLRLWHSGYVLTKPDLPLWYGNISYNKLWKHSLFRNQMIERVVPNQPAVDILLEALGSQFISKDINYSYLGETAKLDVDKRNLMIADRKI